MPLRKLLHSTIFRLTLFYAAFFCVSIILILSFVYFAALREIEDRIEHHITAQLNEAQTVFHQHGIEALKRQTAKFMQEDDEGIFIYVLVDNEGNVLEGNMENWPVDPQYMDSWMMFDIESHSSEQEAIHVLAGEKTLEEGYRILVGYSLKEVERTKKVILDVVLASVLLALIVTAFGGAAFSTTIRHKLESVNQICRQVIGGNLDVKVPVTGSDDQFDRLSGNVNAMLTRIADLISGLKQTSDNIAHDLRTPLNRHRIRLEGIVNHPLEPKKTRETIKAGMEEIDAIVETLNSILRISQAQSGVASGHMITFDLSMVAINVVEFYQEFALEKDIEMKDHIPPDILVTGDKPLITQAIANLIDNAIKHIPKGSTISVSLRADKHYIECVVADNGAGIPPDLYEKVKERFFRMEESRTSPGTGLGLSLVDAVADLHKGELIFEDNKPGLKAILRLSRGT